MSLEGKWLGVGIKYGGTALIAGAEAMHGGIVQLDRPNYVWGIESNGTRLGLGLGGGAQLALIIVMNAPDGLTLQSIDSSDWGIDFSVGARWSSLASALRPILSKPAFAAFLGCARFLQQRRVTPETLEAIRSLGHELSALDSMNSTGGAPTAILMDIPMAGAGAGVGVTYTWGSRFNLFGPPVIVAE
jgi:hypothetical protein